MANRLPKYWVVQADQTNADWKKVITYLNGIAKDFAFTGECFKYYGIENFSVTGVRCTDKLKDFWNNPTLLTIAQFVEMTEEFVLPERWCVKNFYRAGIWFDQNRQQKKSTTAFTASFTDPVFLNCFLHYPAYCGYLSNGIIVTGYTEITQAQFETYVLKEPEFVVPEKWWISVEDTMDSVKRWFNTNAQTQCSTYHNIKHTTVMYYPMFERSHFGITPAGYTEITFDQFSRYIDKPTPAVEAVPTFDKESWYVVADTEEQFNEVCEYLTEQGLGNSISAYNHPNCGFSGGSRYVGKTKNGGRYWPSSWRDEASEITWAQFQSLKKTTVMATAPDQQISKVDLKEIHDNVCDKWQSIIMGKMKTDMFGTHVTFTNEEITKGYADADTSQKELIKKYFIIPVKDKNAFKKVHDSCALKEISKEMFDDSAVLQIAVGIVPVGMQHLAGKSLWVTGEYKVELIPEAHCGGTIITIFEK